MKDLLTCINESIEQINEAKLSENIVIWGKTELTDITNEQSTVKALTKMFKEVLNRSKITILANIEKSNKDIDDKYEVSLRKAAEKASKEYKSVMKMTPEQQEEWIKNKIEDIRKNSTNAQWYSKSTTKYPLIRKSHKESLDFTTANISLAIHDDIFTQQSYHSVKWNDNIKEMAQDLYDDVLTNSDFIEHCKSVIIYTNTENIGKWVKFDVNFEFDDKFEDKLSKDVQKFNDFMTHEYNSGRYMGD